jgi:ubiquinone/menaquinone biosynthesis C-methylase UbiE
MTALEIGHGGGRLMAAAARSFERVIGVDVHDHNPLVATELQRRGIQNFELFCGSGAELPVATASVDFVYSFIVLQHVEKFRVFESYVREAGRVLRPGGIAVLYFGRKSTLSQSRASRLRYRLDRVLERVRMPKGFEEAQAQVNVTNLRVSLPRAKRVARSAGFEVVADLVSGRRAPDGSRLYGGQNGLVLRKVAR